MLQLTYYSFYQLNAQKYFYDVNVIQSNLATRPSSSSIHKRYYANELLLNTKQPTALL